MTSNASAPARPFSSPTVNSSSSPTGEPSTARATRDLEHDRDGGLVVGAEDRVARAHPGAVVDDGLDRVGLGHGVEVCAEQDRAVAAAGDAREQVAALGAGLRGGAVLLDAHAHAAQVVRDGLRAGALGAERARDRAQPGERLVQAAALDVGGGAHGRCSLTVACGGRISGATAYVRYGPLDRDRRDDAVACLHRGYHAGRLASRHRPSLHVRGLSGHGCRRDPRRRHAPSSSSTGCSTT